MTKQADEIAALTAKVNALEQQLPPTMPSEKEIAAHRNEMHQLAERRAAAFNPFTSDQLAAMRAACSDNDASAIVHDQRGAPQGPASIIPSSSGTSVRGSVGRGTVGGGSGWAHQTPLRNGLGQGK
jgi:hypothetical protein